MRSQQITKLLLHCIFNGIQNIVFNKTYFTYFKTPQTSEVTYLKLREVALTIQAF